MCLLSRLPGTGPDDDGIIDADDDASMDSDSASGFSRSRVTTATVAGRSWGPLFPPVQHLFTAAGGDPSTLKAPVSEGDPSPGASTGSASLSGRRMAP
ncbi:unnamed protein product [Boreogadus saida]